MSLDKAAGPAVTWSTCCSLPGTAIFPYVLSKFLHFKQKVCVVAAGTLCSYQSKGLQPQWRKEFSHILNKFFFPPNIFISQESLSSEHGFLPRGKKKSELVAFFLKRRKGFDKSWQCDDFRHKHNGACWSEAEGRQICTEDEVEVEKDDTSWSDWVYGRQCFSWSLLGKTGYHSERWCNANNFLCKVLKLLSELLSSPCYPGSCISPNDPFWL